MPTAGCQLADNCPAAGRGRWLRRVNLAGQPTTTHTDGTLWNRACPAHNCKVRVFQ